MKTIIEQISLWGAIIGSLLLALNIAVSGWAYIPFLMSSIATIYLLRKSNAAKVVEWQCWFFVVVNCIGVIRWLL